MCVFSVACATACNVPLVLRYDERQDRGRVRRGVWVARAMNASPQAASEEFIWFTEEEWFTLAGMTFLAGVIEWGGLGGEYIVVTHPQSRSAWVMAYRAGHVLF